MARRGNPHRRQTPFVLYIRIEIDAVRFQRHLGHKARDRHPVIGFFSECVLISRSPTRSIRRQSAQAKFEWRQITASRHASPTIEAALWIGRHVVHNGASGNDPLVFIQRMLKECVRARAIAEHRVLSHNSARVCESIRKEMRLREQQKAGRLRAICGKDHRFRPLTHFLFPPIEIDHACDAASTVD